MGKLRETLAWLTAIIVLSGMAWGHGMAWGQPSTTPPAADTPSPDAPRATAAGAGEDELALSQSRVADKYARLEDLLIRMSELEGPNNPQRAALLLKAAQQSKEKLTKTQLNNIVRLLNQKQLKRAVSGQQDVQTDLKALLELLLSENRTNRLKNEQARMREYIKEVERLIRQQKTVQGRTEGSSDPKQLAEEQGKVAERTAELAKQMQQNEEGTESGSASRKDDSDEESDGNQQPGKTQKPADDPSEGSDQKNPKNSDQSDSSSPGKSADSQKKPGENQANDKKDPSTPDKPNKPDSEKPDSEKSPSSDSDPQRSDSQKSDSQKSESSPGQPGKSSDSSQPQSSKKPQPGSPPKPGESNPPMPPEDSPDQDQQQPPPEEKSDGFPARKRLAAAEDRMREAERKLKDAQRKEAQEEEERAREELEKAKAELEEILRQLREEEVERMLAMLEGRFRRILEGQLKIYESTKKLDQVPTEQRDRDFPIQSSRLSFDESKLAVDTLKTLNLLHEDGSSLAFPESVEQMHDDMQQVTERLATAKVDRLTQGVEEEIIAALEEMIEALQKAQQDAKDKKEQKQQPPPGGQPNEPPLVDQLAELKMIRALQMRVNTRTQRYAKMLENIEDPVGQATEADLLDVLNKLAEREQRIHQLTRDIVLGKNK